MSKAKRALDEENHHEPEKSTPLHFWRGKLTGDKWEGSWLTSVDGSLPRDCDFATTKTTFCLTSGEPVDEISFDEAAWEGSFTRGTYKSDDEHTKDISKEQHAISKKHSCSFDNDTRATWRRRLSQTWI